MPDWVFGMLLVAVIVLMVIVEGFVGFHEDGW